MLTPSKKDKGGLREAKLKLYAELKERFSLDELEANSLSVLAPALDPRFRNLKFLDAAQ